MLNNIERLSKTTQILEKDNDCLRDPWWHLTNKRYVQLLEFAKANKTTAIACTNTIRQLNRSSLIVKNVIP